jgi:Fe2+ or Zn2+ uptake regulation protein
MGDGQHHLPFTKFPASMISHDEIIETLRAHGIYATTNRVKVLRTAYQLKNNISTPAVLKAINNSIERTSVHRALQLFYRKGFLSAVPNTTGTIEYQVVNQHTIRYDQKKATFICSQCGKPEDIIIKDELLRFQKKFFIGEIIIKGLCERCG